jgi:prepilin-type N-terminal cleavage/methylation domain-containing protein
VGRTGWRVGWRVGLNVRRGFTLAELLVVIGIMGLLIGLLLPVLASVSAAGRKTREMSAARQLMLAWTNYSTINRDAVMPGYAFGLPARTASRRSVAEIAEPPAAARYPWRIAPYLDFNVRGMYVNEQEPLLDAMAAAGEWEHVYFASLAPSLGINATWVGGNRDEGGFNPDVLRAFGRFYVTRLAEVVHPERLLVFTSARGLDPLDLLDGIGVVEGYYEVRSPRYHVLEGDRWAEVYRDGDAPIKFGHVSPRYGGSAVTAFVDCHVDVLTETQLRDMRFWANRAETADYALAPQ